MMRALRTALLLMVAALASSAMSQAWTSAYEAGLKNAKSGQWMDARVAFLKAAAYRPEDSSQATTLPGPVTERRQWRNGAPYSPNFLAAYAAYKASLTLGGDAQASLLKTAAGEFEERLTKGQLSRATYFFLAAIYTKLGDTQKRDATLSAFTAAGDKATWRIDTDGVAPEDLAEVNQGSGNVPNTTTPAGTTVVSPVKPDVGGNVPTTSPTLSSIVAAVPTKYALIIGNSESRLPGDGLPFAKDDAMALRQALIANGGYIDGNIDVKQNITAAELAVSAKALASRMPNGATLLIFFAGKGVNINGKDYLAGVDSAAAADASSMLAKDDLLDPFMRKSTHVFCFFETARSVVDGRYFGQEIPQSGEVAQMFATAPDGSIDSIYRDGQLTGVFVSAFVGVLEDLKSNGIPILEFGWQVFDKMRHGNTGKEGGHSNQRPTLPVLSNMASDAKF